MIRTRITEMPGIRYPIIGGTMMWIPNADFVAAIDRIRVWTNASALKCAELEAAPADFFEEIYPVVPGENAKQMYTAGDRDGGILSVGQGIGICGDIPTVAGLFDRMMAEAEVRLGRFASC